MNVLNWIKTKTNLSENLAKDVVEIFDFNSVYKKDYFIKKLRKLTLSDYSGMNHELNELSILATERKVNAKIITVKRKNEIVGWALLSKEDSEFGFGKGPFIAKKHGALFEVFVDPNHRRTGVATALIKKARKHAGSAHLCVAPFDIKGNNFYKKHGDYKQNSLSW